MGTKKEEGEMVRISGRTTLFYRCCSSEYFSEGQRKGHKDPHNICMRAKVREKAKRKKGKKGIIQKHI